MKKTISQHRGYSFQRVLQEFASTHNLESTERIHIDRWINDGRADEIWSSMAAGMRKGNHVDPDEITAIFLLERCWRLGDSLTIRAFKYSISNVQKMQNVSPISLSACTEVCSHLCRISRTTSNWP